METRVAHGRNENDCCSSKERGGRRRCHAQRVRGENARAEKRAKRNDVALTEDNEIVEQLAKD